MSSNSLNSCNADSFVVTVTDMERQPCKLASCYRAQADKSRVKDYIHRLDNFDGPAVGEIAAGYEMFEEAFEIYKKFDLKVPAIKVLLDNMDDLERAQEYATKARLLLRFPESCMLQIEIFFL